MALCVVIPGLVGTRKVKPIWILLKQETVSDSGISWTICKQSAPHSRQITTPHHSIFTGQMLFLPPNQQRQSTEDTLKWNSVQNESLICSQEWWKFFVFLQRTWLMLYKLFCIWLLSVTHVDWVSVGSGTGRALGAGTSTDSSRCVSVCVQRTGYQQLAVKCDACGLLVLDVVCVLHSTTVHCY